MEGSLAILSRGSEPSPDSGVGVRALPDPVSGVGVRALPPPPLRLEGRDHEPDPTPSPTRATGAAATVGGALFTNASNPICVCVCVVHSVRTVWKVEISTYRETRK